MNDNNISIKEADRQVFRSSYDDGLVDIFLSSVVLMWAVAPSLSLYLGDFWSSAIFSAGLGSALPCAALGTQGLHPAQDWRS